MSYREQAISNLASARDHAHGARRSLDNTLVAVCRPNGPLTQREVAQLLGVSVSTLNLQLVRARAAQKLERAQEVAD